ncbi:hypothetical protein CNE_BB2p03280 (plasmid) [Cupriavidus necator N-1]|uniref:Uncharacterized protein n=1 Tax=Cupriavidus necator (strain ATCC 43291 / DSM 13513 / CCUG 52238 / LMG 8453 / N-1) TaxID=1042878 RepID=F8GXZ9_CUPNN|nr:hypothetical protein [Cupriavidus necator]AEI83123.1 hypothetical protein CNE_BB2p03280 [Cupriavidus necator N-1]MDX6008532.1 hypothetical protein [Cupriavidus necator]
MGEAKRRKLLAVSDQVTSKPASVGLWPLSNASTQQGLDAWFVQRGIDPSRPRLHDTPEFLRAEAQDPKALNMVARLVETRSYTADELQQAERKILVAAEAVADRVARDGRHGLCVVASGVLSRILDELGVWNYTAKSNLAIHFPLSVSVTPRYFYSIDQRQFVAPHAIVVAPPFTVVDVTVRHQMYDKDAMAQYLPVMAATKEFRPYRVTPTELVSPESRAILRRQGMPVETYLARERSAMLELMKQLPSREVTLDGGRLGYGLVAVGGYQERLHELHGKNCSINGLMPMEIFEQDVLPKL